MRSISSFFKAFPYLFKGWVIKYLLITGVISVIIYSLGVYGIWELNDWFASYITGSIEREWLRTALDKTLNIVGFIGLTLIFLFLYKYIVVIIAGPMLGEVSERLESELRHHGQDVEGKFGTGYSIVRGGRIALRNITRELVFTTILFLIGLILSFISPFVAIVVFMIQSYYAGFGNFDFWLERHYNYKDSIQFVKQRRIASMVNGAVFLGILFIPFLGAFVGPMLSTLAATIYLSETTT